MFNFFKNVSVKLFDGSWDDDGYTIWITIVSAVSTFLLILIGAVGTFSNTEHDMGVLIKIASPGNWIWITAFIFGCVSVLSGIFAVIVADRPQKERYLFVSYMWVYFIFSLGFIAALPPILIFEAANLIFKLFNKIISVFASSFNPTKKSVTEKDMIQKIDNLLKPRVQHTYRSGDWW